MPHTGVEEKPPWQRLPHDVRTAIEHVLGGPVDRAMRVWGGYGPAPTFRLRLAGGRRAFVKAVGPADNAFSRAALEREIRVYRELGPLLAPWMPECVGTVELGPWRALLLEDLGPKSAPPWSSAVARGVSRAFAEFHAGVPAEKLPNWVPRPERYLAGMASIWERLLANGELVRLAELAGPESGTAAAWLLEAAPVLDRIARKLAPEQPVAYLHGDLRSDNLRWRDGRLWMLDWPHTGIGAPEFDLAAFAQSVTVDGGPPPEQIVAWYAERGEVRAGALDAAVSAVAGFFADAAWREDVPGLPRLRSFQRAQLRVTLAWTAERLSLPPPTWIDSVTG
jgi:hypothetical protein